MIPFAFLNNRFKWLGLALTIAGFLLFGAFTPNPATLKDGIGLLVQVLILAGLLIIICSRQKVEDEYIDHVRLISLQHAILFLIFIRLLWKTIGYFTADESWMPQWQVNSLLQFYLVIFYYRIYVKERLLNLLNLKSEKQH
jgi:hypothetical protein